MGYACLTKTGASGGGIVHLKTCDDLTGFEADPRRYGYAHQMAFYRALLAIASAGEVLPVHKYIAIEKKEPFRGARGHGSGWPSRCGRR